MGRRETGRAWDESSETSTTLVSATDVGQLELEMSTMLVSITTSVGKQD
jgi:hypothetical protein